MKYQVKIIFTETVKAKSVKHAAKKAQDDLFWVSLGFGTPRKNYKPTGKIIVTRVK